MRRRILLLCVALIAGVLIFSFSIATAIADTRPAFAAVIAPYLSNPKSRMAEVAFAATIQSGNTAAAKNMAYEAALRDPLNVAAVRTLGYINRIQKNDAKANSLFAYANRLTRRDLGVNLDYVIEAAKRGDVNDAIHYFDLGLRTSSGSWDRLFPIIYQISGDPAVVPALASALRKDPQWKWPFLDGLVRQGPDPAVTARLFDELEASEPLNNDDLHRALIGRLIDTGHYSEALARFRAFAARKGIRSLTNGDFERPAMDVPLEWSSAPDKTIETGIAKNVTDKALRNSLYFKVPADGDGELLRMIAVVNSGPHSLSVLVGPALEGTPGDLTFNAECIGTGASIAHAVVDRPAAGARSFAFVAPPGCNGVRLYLRASSAGTGPAWVSWLDHLALDPAGRPSR